jgi:hypothetical protein
MGNKDFSTFYEETQKPLWLRLKGINLISLMIELG